MVAVATAVAGALGWPLYTQLMQAWGVAYLAPLAYVLVSWTAIVVIATVLGAGKSVAERERLLRVCPIVACNAAVLAVSLGNAAVADTLTWDAALGSSIGAGLGERERLLRVCPIVACNAAVLAVSLGNAAVADTLTWDAALGSSIGAGLGVLLAVVLFAFVRDRIDERLVPAALRGLPITLVTASLMALAFTGVAGIAGGLFV